MRFPQGWEWLVILLVILLLFGAKRLPDAARGLGRSMRILKAETKGLREDEESAPIPPAVGAAEQTTPGPAAQVTPPAARPPDPPITPTA